MEVENKMTWQMFLEIFAPCDDFAIDRINDVPQSRDLFDLEDQM